MATPADRNYRNDHRSGVTKPDLVEVISKDDPRHRFHNPRQYCRPNRAERRAAGFTPGLFRNRSRSPRPPEELHPLSADARLLAMLRGSFTETAA